MTRPILWALGISAAATLWGVGLAGRLDQRAPPPAPDGGQVMMHTPAPVALAPTTLVLEANAQGHFFTQVQIDGNRLSMMVDTGATLCAFSQEDAERAGIRVYERDFTARTQTANGTVAVAPVRIPAIRIGAITVRDVEAVIVPRGKLSTSLLGMSFLRRLPDVGMARGRLTLRG
ncbi:TIGR02281 family clan AA aspartic protease [Methylobacterium sp. Leaf466]|uniref:retropepsin-like aspartic protease family protein n=1 Tax=Methylobacterium sp. Leaf466 TaxID=1736386 RepID=UPI0006FEDF40|nr:TIGR02281 family clan AA aspartic protease [Methylobacterium sp. Leaf466]KQT78234.1 hypothetical protein ASG59_09670 [Methylobacterium sp. Leaf466]